MAEKRFSAQEELRNPLILSTIALRLLSRCVCVVRGGELSLPPVWLVCSRHKKPIDGQTD